MNIDRKKYLMLMDSAIEISEADEEIGHSKADDILCDLLVELGYPDVVDKYNEVLKWYA